MVFQVAPNPKQFPEHERSDKGVILAELVKAAEISS